MESKHHQVPCINSGSSSFAKYQKVFDKIHHYSSIAFVLALAKDVGILDTLLEADRSMTSQEIADYRNLKERYTREILATLVCAEVVKASTNENGLLIYYMEENAKNVLAQGYTKEEISMPLVFKSGYENIKECVPSSGPGGVGFTEELFSLVGGLAGRDDQTVDFLMESVPELKKRLEKGIQVIEFGSGSASLIGKLASKYPNSTFIASDVSIDIVKAMETNLGHLSNICFEVIDLCAPPKSLRKNFDWILMKKTTHVLPHPAESLKSIRQMVAEPEGIFTFIDGFGQGDPRKSIGDTREATSYARSTFFCLPSCLLQNAESEAYGCCWSRDTGMRITREAGFEATVLKYTSRETLFIAKPI